MASNQQIFALVEAPSFLTPRRAKESQEVSINHVNNSLY